MVAHAEQLAEAHDAVLGLDVVLLHQLDGEPDRVLVVRRHHDAQPGVGGLGRGARVRLR